MYDFQRHNLRSCDDYTYLKVGSSAQIIRMLLITVDKVFGKDEEW